MKAILLTSDREIPGLEFEREYTILSVVSYPDRQIEYRIRREKDGIPSLFSAADFFLTDQVIPSGWAIDVKGQRVEIAPEELLAPGFWESYFNAEPETVRTFNRIADKLEKPQTLTLN